MPHRALTCYGIDPCKPPYDRERIRNCGRESESEIDKN